jgi:hypothetical protein
MAKSGVAVNVPALDDLEVGAGQDWGEGRGHGALMILVRGDGPGEQSLDEQGEAPVGAVQAPSRVISAMTTAASASSTSRNRLASSLRFHTSKPSADGRVPHGWR